MFKNVRSDVGATVGMQVMQELRSGQRRVAVNHLKACAYREELIRKGILKPVSPAK